MNITQALTLHSGDFTGDELFSIVIPTWDNLEFVKLCVESIRKNSTYKHQIVLHINDGSDGTQEWADKEGDSIFWSTRGACFRLQA